jgi:hypothetical protein
MRQEVAAMKIGINPGHTVSGTTGCGAVGYIDESVEVRKVGAKLMELLRAAGHTVIDCTNNYAPTVSSNLNQIVELANKQPLDLFVSIHFNSGGGKGTEVFTYNAEKHTEAVKVCEKMNALGFTNRGVKDGSNLYVVRHSDAKAMLVEVCFVDTQSDVDLYHSVGVDAVAKAIAEAITGETVNEESEEIDMEELNKLTARVEQLEKQCMQYDYMDDNMPSWAKPTVQKLMDKGLLEGDDSGKLGLTMDTLKVLVVLDRNGAF